MTIKFVTLFISMVCVLWLSVVQAKTLSAIGPIYPITEPDLLQQIQQKLAHLAKTGHIKTLQAKMKRQLSATVNEPPAVIGLGTVDKTQHVLFDPSITLSHAIEDNQGHVLAKAGTVINPLDNVSLDKPLLFFDGSNPAQRYYALTQYQQRHGKLVLILTRGRIIDLMKQWRIRLYFDQGGRMTTRLHIKAVPALVTQQGKQLSITEVAL